VNVTTSRRGRVEWYAAVAVFLLGVFVRGWHLDAGWFGVDQARDVQTALDIAAGRDFPTVGPTMRRLTSLGALYYYVWAVPHLVSSDPIAAYAFAAVMGIAALALVWRFAGRAFGPTAGLVAVAAFATAPVAVIDGRVAWAPAALPVVAMLLVGLLSGPFGTGRLAVLGAILGVAVQLHLSMVAWGAAAAVVLLVRWPGWRAVGASALGFLATGFPAVYAAFANAGHDAGLTTLPSRATPDVIARLLAVPMLGAHVLDAFWQWPDAPNPWVLLVWIATGVLAIAALAGMGRLTVGAARRDATAIAVMVPLVFQVGMVAALPGDAWYYYLDATVPLVALAAGACWWRTSPARRPILADGALVAVVVSSLVLGAALVRWIATAAAQGYLVVHPAALALDGAGGRDASAPGRLPTVATKRAVADALAADPADFATRWRTTHGSAFDDVTGDNGFWLRRTATAPHTSAAATRHASVWYRDDPNAPATATDGFTLETHGPIVLARYEPRIAYHTCRDEQDPVALPIRVVPDPRRYGDGTLVRATGLPRRITCTLAAASGATTVVAAITSGSVVLRDAEGRAGTAGAVSTLCLRGSADPAPVTIEVTVPAGVASDLDLYERPDPACTGKIAP
jgi:hypothetical protein